MGGYGSGRRWDCKSTTSECHQLDVRRLQRGGYLREGQWFTTTWSRNGEAVGSISGRTESGQVILSYRHRRGDEPWADEKYAVPLDWTRCHYGGYRAWFLCPASGCGRRVAVLYLGGSIFACRHCYGLNYQSQHEQAWDRALSRYQNIRVKLGGEPGCIHPFPDKPKGMHWRTYEHWCMKAEQAESCSWPNWVYRLPGLSG